jgi:hypothetical protein
MSRHITLKQRERTDSRPTTSGDRPAFNTLAGHVVGSLVAFNALLERCTDAEIDHFIEQTGSLSTTNCWFFEYALKETLLDFARSERRRRANRKEASP